MFAILGSRVILVEKRPRLLEFADSEMVEALSYHLRDQRVTMRLNEEVASVEDRRQGRRGGAHEKQQSRSAATRCSTRSAARAMWTSSTWPPPGSRPTTAGASRWTPNTAPRSPISSPPAMSSASPAWLRSPWSRDASPPPTPCGLKIHSNPATYPYGIYTIPEISFTGKTEEQLTDEDVPYEVGVAYYRDTARGQIRGDTTGRLKMIFHRETREILGVHIIGEGATELLHIGQAVMILKGTIDYFVETVFNYPTLAECYKSAAFNGINKLMRF